MKKVLQGKLLFILVLFMFTFSLFSLYFISAQEDFISVQKEGQTVAGVIFSPIQDLFANWEGGNLNINIAKYLFFILIALFIWSILDFSGIIEYQTINWIISFIVAFLSIAYVAPNQIWILLTSYDALGLTLIFIIPLVILGLFALRIAAVGGASGVLFQYLMWIIYLIFLIGTFVVGLINGKINKSDPFAWIYLAVIVLVFLVILFNKLLIKWIGRTILEQESERAGNVLKKAVALRRMEADALSEQAAGGRKRR